MVLGCGEFASKKPLRGFLQNRRMAAAQDAVGPAHCVFVLFFILFVKYTALAEKVLFLAIF